MSQKNEFILSGLSCSHCAAVIENKINDLPWVDEARVNLATQILYLDAASVEESRQELQSLVDAVEDGITVEYRSDAKDPSDSKKSWNITSLLLKRWGEILGALLFLALTFLKGNELFFLELRIALYGAAYVLVGRTVLLSGLKNMKNGRLLDENFLMIIATAGAFAIGEFPEAVAVMLFYQVGEFFQELAVDRSRRSIRNLMDSKSGMVQVLEGDEVKEIAPEDVAIGTLYRLRPGDRVPLDGIIEKGKGSVDSSALTGESYPRQVNEGSSVLSGFVNRESVLEVRSSKILSESSYSRIIRMVEESSSRKAQSEQFITRFAHYYTPAVVALAVLLAVIPPLLIEGAIFRDWLYRALVFLVVSCPCALVISIPLGFFAGIGRASREGILVKGGNYLEALNGIDTVFMDKTGTLTRGDFSVSAVLPAPGINGEDMLRYAAIAEASSTHPIAESIVKTWKENSGEIKVPAADSTEEIAGHGIRAHWKKQVITIGKPGWLREAELDLIPGPQGKTTVHIAVDSVYQGAIVLSDEIRSDTAQALIDLKNEGIESIIMLTGDSEATAAAVAAELELSSYQADLLPHQKVEALEMSIAQGKRTAFLGDGINDAPVLARADVGIAMGGLGSDAAIEAADIVLMADEPSRLVNARRIARKTREIIVQNIVLALGIKAVILVLAALGYAGMGLAVFGDVGVALLAILNVLRIMSGRVPTSQNAHATAL
ncbi:MULTISPECIES: heavy metal translocating P-type ATPase [unclassified Oceanispirochaeta]|uniref:heavy metal translocating P-type ATPase n=1 Tax=unclassified Oceanispirochaeta TaxID=2635722 RepID=UPI0018F32649|nr:MULTISPECIES: heavy metal translocating P-type ATPase [unclassified Oceanispirochaeta]